MKSTLAPSRLSFCGVFRIVRNPNNDSYHRVHVGLGCLMRYAVPDLSIAHGLAAGARQQAVCMFHTTLCSHVATLQHSQAARVLLLTREV